MRLTVASGKGGVGKSMIASALAVLFSEDNHVVAIDCDVDAPNLAIWLGIDNSNPKLAYVSKKISTVKKPIIDTEKCGGCGTCVQNCQFGALKLDKRNKATLIAYRCEGCGLCKILCPQKAITMKAVKNCLLQMFKTDFGFTVVQGQIKPGEAESGEAVTEIREYAKDIAKKDPIFIQDAAAGIGCPVIASIVGSDYTVAVAEPSMSSFSDLKRVLKVVEQFKVPWGIVINKADLNPDVSEQIKDFAGKKLLGTVGYDQKITKNIVNFKPIMGSGLEAEKEIQRIYKELLQQLP